MVSFVMVMQEQISTLISMILLNPLLCMSHIVLVSRDIVPSMQTCIVVHTLAYSNG